MRYFFVAKEVTKKASLAAMAGFVVTRGRVLQFYQNSRAYDLMVTLAGRKEPPAPDRAESGFATALDRLESG